MPKGALLMIRLYESDHKKWFSRTAYEEIVRHLWSKGAPGITVFRAIEGLDARGHLQNFYSDYASGLPITMEVYGTPEEINHICVDLSDRLPRTSRIIVLQNVIDLKENEVKEGAEMNSAYMLKVYMKEEDSYHHMPLYHAILLELKRKSVLWVDVQHALEGFGKEHVIRKNHLLSFSEHSPIILEAILNAETKDVVLDDLHPMLERASGPSILLGVDFLLRP